MYGPGIIRKLDYLVRIVIPKEIRKRHEISEGDFVSIIDEGSHVIVKKYRSSCVFCGGDEDLSEYKNLYVCRKCRRSLAREMYEESTQQNSNFS